MAINWESLGRDFPNAMAVAIDGSGMFSVFSTACKWHGQSRTWIPVGQGEKTSLKLLDMPADGTPQATLEVRPGYEQQFKSVLAAHDDKGVPRELPKEVSVPGDNRATGVSHYCGTTGDLPNPLAEPQPETPTEPDDPGQTNLLDQLSEHAGPQGPTVACEVTKHDLTEAIKLLYKCMPKTRRAQCREKLASLVGDLED